MDGRKAQAGSEGQEQSEGTVNEVCQSRFTSVRRFFAGVDDARKGHLSPRIVLNEEKGSLTINGTLDDGW